MVRKRERAQQTWSFNTQADKRRTNFRLSFFLFSSVHFHFIGILLLLLRHTNYTLEFFGCYIKKAEMKGKASIENKTLGNKFDLGVNQHGTPRSLVILIFSLFIHSAAFLSLSF